MTVAETRLARRLIGRPTTPSGEYRYVADLGPCSYWDRGKEKVISGYKCVCKFTAWAGWRWVPIKRVEKTTTSEKVQNTVRSSSSSQKVSTSAKSSDTKINESSTTGKFGAAPTRAYVKVPITSSRKVRESITRTAAPAGPRIRSFTVKSTGGLSVSARIEWEEGEYPVWVTIAWGDGTSWRTRETDERVRSYTVPHTYSKAGTYTVRGIVVDNRRRSDATSKTITVGAPAPAAPPGMPMTTAAILSMIRRREISPEEALRRYRNLVSPEDLIREGLMSVEDAIKKGFMNVWDAINKHLIAPLEAYHKRLVSWAELQAKGLVSRHSSPAPEKTKEEEERETASNERAYKTWLAKAKEAIDKADAKLREAKSMFVSFTQTRYPDCPGMTLMHKGGKGVWVPSSEVEEAYLNSAHAGIWNLLSSARSFYNSAVQGPWPKVYQGRVMKPYEYGIITAKQAYEKAMEVYNRAQKAISIMKKWEGSMMSPPEKGAWSRLPGYCGVASKPITTPGQKYSQQESAKTEPKPLPEEKPLPISAPELSQLKEKKDNIIAKITQLRREVRDLEDTYNSLRDKHGLLMQSIPLLEGERDRLKAELNELMNRMREIGSATRDRLEQELSRLQEEVNSLRSEASSLESQVARLRSVVSDLRSRLSGLGITYRVSLTGGYPYGKLASSIGTRTYSIPQTFKDVGELRSAIEKLKSDISLEERELSTLESRRAQLSQYVNFLKNRVNSLTSKRDAINKEIGELKARISELRKKIAAAAPTSLKDLESRYQSLLEERDRLISRINELRAELSALREEESRLRSILASAGVSIPAIPTLPTPPSPEAGALMNQLTSLQSMFNQVQQRVSDLQQRVAYDPALLSELQAARRERSMIAQQIQSIQQQLMAMAQERPQDLGLETLMLLMMMMQQQAQSQAQLMSTLYQSMLQQTYSTSAKEIRDLIEELEAERRQTEMQIQMLQKQIEELKKAPPPPPAPRWYPGMLIRAIIEAIFPAARAEALPQPQAIETS